jgi:very-short-patch-repair endonuclease
MAQMPIPPPCGEGGQPQAGREGVAPRPVVGQAPTSPTSHSRPPSVPSLREGPPSPQGGRMVRASIGRARDLRKTMTRYEVKLWLQLKALKPQGFRFRRQVPIERFIVDFACFENRLIVEVDGMQHGFDAEAAKDAIRDGVLASAGFTVLRFSNSDVWQNIDGVVATIFSGRSRVAGLWSDAP